MKPTVWAVAAAALWAGGCAMDDNAAYTTAGRQDRGLVMILPGIEGVSPINLHIREGLAGAGIRCAMPIFEWGLPVPLVGAALNQTDVPADRGAGRRVADRVVRYQLAHPGRPVYVVGHSAGGGVAVFAAEALGRLPNARPVDGLVLLSASISADYDLTAALRSCRNGLVNFYNPADVGLLGVGTALLGNVDGGHGASAGRTGFVPPRTGAPPGQRSAYRKLHQVRITPAMVSGEGGGPHVADTAAPFVATYVAEWIISPTWPPPPAEPLAPRGAR